MYSNMLLEEEKQAFIDLLLYLSKIDGELTDEEVLFIESKAVELDISKPNLKQRETPALEAILSQITNPISKRIVIMELVNLAFADKDYSQSERIGILNIANTLGVKESKVIKIEEWVNKGVEWANEGLNIVNSEEE